MSKIDGLVNQCFGRLIIIPLFVFLLLTQQDLRAFAAPPSLSPLAGDAPPDPVGWVVVITYPCTPVILSGIMTCTGPNMSQWWFRIASYDSATGIVSGTGTKLLDTSSSSYFTGTLHSPSGGLLIFHETPSDIVFMVPFSMATGSGSGEGQMTRNGGNYESVGYTVVPPPGGHPSSAQNSAGASVSLAAAVSATDSARRSPGFLNIHDPDANDARYQRETGNTSSAPECTDVAIFGLRGAATDAGTSGGFGTVSAGVADVVQIQLQQRGHSVKRIGVPYAQYFFGPQQNLQFPEVVRDALPYLGTLISSERQQCPDELFVIIAHSEGAGVVHAGLAPDMNPKWASNWHPTILKQVSTFIFLGDPLHYPNTEYDRQSHDSKDSDGTGIFVGNGLVEQNPWAEYSLWGDKNPSDKVQSKDFQRIASYCLPKDPVCGNNWNLADGATHGNYGDTNQDLNDGVPDKAAVFVEEQLFGSIGLNPSPCFLHRGGPTWC